MIHRSFARTAVALCLLTLVAATGPASAWALRVPATVDGVPAAARPQAAPDAAPDNMEDDDTPAQARDLTGRIPGLAPYPEPSLEPTTQARTIDKASDALGADYDWVRFTLEPEDVESGVAVLIEAFTSDPGVDPVIEVYGPGAFTPAAPEDLGEDPDRPGRTETDPEAAFAGDDDPWFAAGSASVVVILDPSDPPADAVTYYARIRPYYQGDFGQADPPVGYNDGAGEYTLRVRNGQTLRLSGTDRFKTAVAVSRERYPDGWLAGGSLVLANGMNFPDALAGSTLAGAVGGPLLLTLPASLPAAVSAEIDRLAPSTVYVLGSNAAVSSAVLSAVGARPSVTSVVRVEGTDRLQTARAVAKKADELAEGGVPSIAFVVNGFNFPDALSASPMATWNAAPVLLTSGTQLSSAVSSAITELGVTDVVIVGGPSAVSSGVESALASKLGGTGHVRRLSGSDRFATASAFAAWATEGDAFIPNGTVGTPANPDGLEALLLPPRVGLASGMSFPDALAGGVACGHASSPILLTLPADLSTAVWDHYLAYIQPFWIVFFKSYAYGGTPALSRDTFGFFDSLTLPSPAE